VIVRSLLVGLLVLALGPAVSRATSPPDPPTGGTPPDGSVGIPADAALCVDVTDPDGDPLDVRFYGRELTAEPGEDFTVIALPDTQ
jgi:hypothetical protein